MDRPTPMHGISGTGVERPQWESGNRHVRFPFADDAGPADYPFDMLSDACVVVVASGADAGRPSDEPVAVGCLHVGPALVSVMVYAGSDPILCCTVPKSRFEPFSPYPMTPVRRGCSGTVSFGSIRFDAIREPKTYRDMVPLSDSAVVRPVVGGLDRFVQPEYGREAAGRVGLVVPDGVGMVLSEDGHTSRISFSLGGAALDEVTVSSDAADASGSSAVPLSMPVPIRSINGVRPDALGRIAIVFAHDVKEVPA